jgi:hypothetical protein
MVAGLVVAIPPARPEKQDSSSEADYPFTISERAILALDCRDV